MDTKHCAGCGHAKPVTDFPLRTDRPGARRSRCYACERDRQRTIKADAGSRQRIRESKAAYQRRNTEKRAAHKTVEAAILRGELKTMPCARCGAAVGIHAHHDDYTKPLDVMWLCPRHHRERHRELRANQEAA